MATFYLDYEGGNDANDGTTFANRWKTFTNGATAARIAPGDTIRVMGSPNPTSLGVNGTWTGGTVESSFSGSQVAFTNATPIVCTTTSAHNFSTGDTVVVRGVTGNTNANGTWTITVTSSNDFQLNDSVGNGTTAGGTRAVQRINCRVVTLASAVTQNIAVTGPTTTVAWTASANVTATLSTAVCREHQASSSIAIAAGFTTGKAAYYTLPSTLDLSGYQQVSLWLYQSAGTLSSTAYTLELCTDTTGDTSVHTITLPSPGVTNRWTPVTVDLGVNLNSAIKSIALNVGTDLGAATLLVDNIIACKASSSNDSLTLHSLIGKNISGDTFYGIQSINGTRVLLDLQTNTLPNIATHPVYQGTSGTVTTYKRETIKVTRSATDTTIQDSGTSGNLIAFEGGWDRTNMSSQNLETWLDGQNGAGTGMTVTAKNYLSFNKFAYVRFNNGFSATNAGGGNLTILDFIAANNNSTNGFVGATGLGSNTVSDLKAACFNDNGVNVSDQFAFTTIGLASSNNTSGFVNTNAATTCDTITQANGNNQYGINTVGGVTLKTITAASNNAISGVLSTGSSNTIYSLTAENNTQWGYISSSSVGDKIYNLTTSNNGSGGISSGSGLIYLKNATINEASEVGTITSRYGRVLSTNHDNTANNHKIFTDGGLISSESSVRHTASGIAWKLQPTSTTRDSVYPLSLSIAKVAVAANALVTVKAWMRRDNTALTMRLVCKRDQLAGIGTSDVTSSMTAAANTWEELTITFTPTEAGVVEITAEAFGGSTNTGYVDDLTISQA